MDVVLLSNPASGRGLGKRVASETASALLDAGHAVRALTVREWEDLAAACAKADLLVIVGGDGTVHHCLELLVKARAGEPKPVPRRGAARLEALADALLGSAAGGHANGTRASASATLEPERGSGPAALPPRRPSPAVWHVPMGTENLFAREFGMTRRPAQLVRAVERWRVRTVDLGLCRGWPFAIMVGLGPDASVIHRLDVVRRGAISHLSYVAPTLREALSPRLPRLRVSIDGRTVVDGARGSLVVANSRQYALRVDYCRGASVSDGLLDAVFLPASTSASALLHTVAARLRAPWPGVVRGRGRRVEALALDGPAPVQIDGEVGGMAEPGRALVCEAAPGALRALEPG